MCKWPNWSLSKINCVVIYSTDGRMGKKRKGEEKVENTIPTQVIKIKFSISMNTGGINWNSISILNIKHSDWSELQFIVRWLLIRAPSHRCARGTDWAWDWWALFRKSNIDSVKEQTNEFKQIHCIKKQAPLRHEQASKWNSECINHQCGE